MLYSRQAIYNSELKIEANEIIINDEQAARRSLEENEQAHLESFLNMLIHEVDANIDKFKLIVPQHFYPCLSTLADEIKSKIVVKIDVASLNTDSIAMMDKIHEDGYHLAVDVQDKKVLDLIPADTDFLIIDEAFIDMLDEELDELFGRYKVVAKGVNDYNRLDELKALQLEFFSGEFIEKPTAIENDVISPNKTSILKLIATLNDPDIEVSEVTKVFVADNVLSFKLLKIVNSPLYRGIMEISSVQDAIVRFGYVNLKKWVMMLSLCSLGDKPVALIKLALERAIMCANLATELGYDHIDSYYTAGLLSTIDAFFNHSINNLLEQISLSEDIKLAILRHEGTIGRVLHNVTIFQHGNISTSNERLSKVFIKSAEESNEMLKAIGIL